MSVQPSTTNQPNNFVPNSEQQSSNELKVSPIDNSKRVMYNAKMLLTKNFEIELVAGTGGSPVAVRAAELNIVKLSCWLEGDELWVQLLEDFFNYVLTFRIS